MKSKVIYYGEAYPQEKLAVQYLRSLVPEENYHILVSTIIPKKNSSREIDVTLICPRGIFAIEMKDWAAQVVETLDIGNSKLTLTNGIETVVLDNPIRKIDDQRKKVASFVKDRLDPLFDRELFEKIGKNFGVKGVLFLTSPLTKFNLGNTGPVECVTRENISSLWEQKYTEDIFNQEDIEILLSLYGEGEESGGENVAFKKDQVVGGYRIEKLIFDGEAYKIYAAVNDLLRQRYIIKALWVDPGDMADMQELTREIALRDINAKNKLGAEDYVVFSNIPPFSFGSYIINVMQWADYVSLEERMKTGISLQEKKAVIKRLLIILDNMHGKDVFHRDLNPRNIVFLDGGMKVINFDYAKLMDKPTVVNGILAKDYLYKPGEILTKGNIPVDYHADLYSLGIILNELITGSMPFKELVDKFKKVKIEIRGFLGEETDRRLENSLQLLISNELGRRDEGYALLREIANEWN